MTGRLSQPPASANRHLRWAAIAFVIGWGVHLLDHLRRGMSASPHAIMVGGMIQGVFVVVAIAMAITGRRRAPEAAIAVGFGSAVLFTYAHLLPSFLPASKDLLRKFDRTGNIRTEPLQSPGVADRLGVAPTSLLDAVRWLDSSGTVYSRAGGAHPARPPR